MFAREYSPTDLGACLEIFDTNVPEFFTELERAPFASFLETLPGPYLVLQDPGGRVVGCGGYAIEPGATKASLCWGMVRRESQRRGLGRRLVEERLARIRRDAGVTEVILNTSQHTQAFYESFGFVTESVIPDGFGPGLDRCDLRLSLVTTSSPGR